MPNDQCPMRNCRTTYISSFVISLSFRHSAFVIAVRYLAVTTIIFGACTLSLSASARDTVDIVLPTDNDALFSGDGAAFYQYVERDYKGAKSTPWRGDDTALCETLWTRQVALFTPDSTKE